MRRGRSVPSRVESIVVLIVRTGQLILAYVKPSAPDFGRSVHDRQIAARPNAK